jgi:hypothetical protein
MYTYLAKPLFQQNSLGMLGSRAGQLALERISQPIDRF